MLVAFRHNRAIAHEKRVAEYHLEIAELMMRDAKSFQAWWKTLCSMSQNMQFMSIGLWKRHSRQCIKACTWDAPEGRFPSGGTAEFSLPLQRGGVSEWEIRARLWTDGCLEIGGQRATLLARIIDEFPPPEREDEESEPFADIDQIRPSTFGETGTMTVSHPRILENPTCMPSPLSVMGVPVVPFETYDHALECIEKVVESHQQSFWVPVNPVKIYHAWHIPELLSILQQSDACLCDGVGVSIASRILNGRGIKRITGCDLFFKLLPLASRKRWGVYLLGALPESNASARSAIQRMYPDLRIVGSQDGYFRDSQEVIEKVNESGADLLFVGMGSPKQEYWISRHRHAINARFCMGVGGSLDVAAGSVRRAPRIFCVTGTEFLFRLAMEPQKRLPNQVILLSFLIQVIGRRSFGAGAPTEGAYSDR
jgi:N-acetylglucosaminyldiphosphoundecaprenol N-acetyl-beta-D-mannosaminyltransferase